jgi:hypothetical protein
MNDERIRIAIERNVKAVTLRPSVGQGTAVTKATRGRARVECIASIAQYRDGEGYRIPGEFVISKASKDFPLDPSLFSFVSSFDAFATFDAFERSVACQSRPVT